jgi:hypothetical protein
MQKTFDLLHERKICYELPHFQPFEVNAKVLYDLGLGYPIADHVNEVK